VPEVELLLAGKICEVVGDLPGVAKLGYLENLDDAYAAADIVINPTQFGTGLKIKSIEALGQSKILVSTPAGSEGLESGANEAFLIAHDSDEFAQHLVKVLTHPGFAQLLAEAAYAFAENYNRETFYLLKDALGVVV
jgi:glycosyltransferase involved in cell wall biosynthesis